MHRISEGDSVTLKEENNEKLLGMSKHALDGGVGNVIALARQPRPARRLGLDVVKCGIVARMAK